LVELKPSAMGVFSFYGQILRTGTDRPIRTKWDFNVRHWV
jgi:hypothetical protein